MCRPRGRPAHPASPPGLQGPPVAALQPIHLLDAGPEQEAGASGGASFALYARQGPFPCLHGLAFAASPEAARQAAANQLAKRYLGADLGRGLAAARDLDSTCPGLEPGDLALLRALPADPAQLAPDAFAYATTSAGSTFSVPLAGARRLVAQWREDGPVRAQVTGEGGTAGL